MQLIENSLKKLERRVYLTWLSILIIATACLYYLLKYTTGRYASITIVSAVIGLSITMIIAFVVYFRYKPSADLIPLSKFTLTIVWSGRTKKKIFQLRINYIEHDVNALIMYSPDKEKYREKIIFPEIRNYLRTKIDAEVLRKSGGEERLLNNLGWPYTGY